MKTSLTIIVLTLLACTGASASPDQPRVIIKCSAAGGDCQQRPAPPTPALLPPATAGAVEMSSMAAPMPVAPPSLAAGSMPPAPSARPVQTASHTVARIPRSAHAACAKRRHGSSITVRLKSKQTLAGFCEKDGGKMRFRMRDDR